MRFLVVERTEMVTGKGQFGDELAIHHPDLGRPGGRLVCST
jgi:hypothetical protein